MVLRVFVLLALNESGVSSRRYAEYKVSFCWKTVCSACMTCAVTNANLFGGFDSRNELLR